MNLFVLSQQNLVWLFRSLKNPGSVAVVLFLSTSYELKQNINWNSIDSEDHPLTMWPIRCTLFAWTSGFLTSPNFPNNFPPNTFCTSIFTIPVGFIITLTFLNFTLKPNEQTGCTGSLRGARVIITNVASDYDAHDIMLCGQNIPSPVNSFGNFIQARLL